MPYGFPFAMPTGDSTLEGDLPVWSRMAVLHRPFLRKVADEDKRDHEIVRVACFRLFSFSSQAHLPVFYIASGLASGFRVFGVAISRFQRFGGFWCRGFWVFGCLEGPF
jgi:hypothetical protein